MSEHELTKYQMESAVSVHQSKNRVYKQTITVRGIRLIHGEPN